MKKIQGYISNYEEALLLVHAARLGGVELSTERLNSDEREMINSGNIFIFIENENGMKRWTDGRIWSPSKICGEFLIYQEVPRHMSKNSIKKRKEIEKVMDSIESVEYMRARVRDEPVDRTTLHKKTVCIKHENANYHIIAYYRPIFVNSSLMEMPYFKRLSAVLIEHPGLRMNDELFREMADANFWNKYGLIPRPGKTVLDSNKRSFLENIALEVLCTLGRNVQKKSRASPSNN